MKAKIKKQGEKWQNSVDTLPLPRNVFNVVVLGAGGVGKTSLVTRFVKNEFSDRYNPTVEDLYERPIELRKGVSAVLQVLDTAGSYQFPAMKRLTLQYGEAFIIVYSVVDPASLDEAVKLQQEIYEAKGTEDVPMVFVGNKCDLTSGTDKRLVSHAIASTLTRGKNCILAETSAKYNVNVSGVFTALLAQVALANSQSISNERPRKKRSVVSWFDWMRGNGISVRNLWFGIWTKGSIHKIRYPSPLMTWHFRVELDMLLQRVATMLRNALRA